MGSGDVGKGNRTSTENEAMKKKRELHDVIIAKVKTQKVCVHNRKTIFLKSLQEDQHQLLQEENTRSQNRAADNSEPIALEAGTNSRKRKHEAGRLPLCLDFFKLMLVTSVAKKKVRPTTFRDDEFFLSHFPKNKHKEEG